MFLLHSTSRAGMEAGAVEEIEFSESRDGEVGWSCKKMSK